MDDYISGRGSFNKVDVAEHGHGIIEIDVEVEGAVYLEEDE